MLYSAVLHHPGTLVAKVSCKGGRQRTATSMVIGNKPTSAPRQNIARISNGGRLTATIHSRALIQSPRRWQCHDPSLFHPRSKPNQSGRGCPNCQPASAIYGPPSLQVRRPPIGSRSQAPLHIGSRWYHTCCAVWDAGLFWFLSPCSSFLCIRLGCGLSV